MSQRVNQIMQAFDRNGQKVTRRRRAGRSNRIPAIKISPRGTNGPNAAPTFRSRPDFVSGIPTFLEMRDLSAEIPKNLHQEKPPLFICQHPSPF
jgi:hypothetical protein